MNSKRMRNRAMGRKIAHREPEHHEKGYRGSMSSHRSHESPASMGASKGSGPVPGAGELNMPFNGPGVAARRYAGAMEMPNAPTPSGSAPKGMSVYREE
jgi:hypothetical protein